LPGDDEGRVLVTEFRGMALNGLFCADVLRPLDLVPLTDFTYKYHPDFNAVVKFDLSGSTAGRKLVFAECNSMKCLDNHGVVNQPISKPAEIHYRVCLALSDP